ncbi:MAG: riboflavin kinase [Rikenellaceae bacterium]
MTDSNRVVGGVVIGGKRLGREIGYPTANIEITQGVDISYGVYVVGVRFDNNTYFGVANFGLRPTVTTTDKPILEVHLFEYSGDIYGKYIEVELIEFLRSEDSFSSVEQLHRAIERDANRAKLIVQDL